MRSGLKRAVGVALIFAAVIVVGPALAAAPSPQGHEASSLMDAAPTPVPTPAYEDDQRIIQGDEVVGGENFTLRSGEVLRGDLTSFGGNVVLEENSRVEGNVTLFGGDADVYGTVMRDLTLLGGAARLRPSARIEGKLTTLGGSITRDPGSVVGNQSTQAGAPSWDWQTPFRSFMNRVNNVFSTIGGIILISLLSVAIVVLFPAYVARIAEVAQQQWQVSGGVGLLTFIIVPIAVLVLAITVCLIPAAVLLLVAWALAMLGGWAVAARILGERLAVWLKVPNWTIAGQTALGAVILAVLGTLPILGWLIGLLATSWGMGALILVVVNTRSRI